jgi:hypothetical protein
MKRNVQTKKPKKEPKRRGHGLLRPMAVKGYFNLPINI